MPTATDLRRERLSAAPSPITALRQERLAAEGQTPSAPRPFDGRQVTPESVLRLAGSMMPLSAKAAVQIGSPDPVAREEATGIFKSLGRGAGSMLMRGLGTGPTQQFGPSPTGAPPQDELLAGMAGLAGAGLVGSVASGLGRGAVRGSANILEDAAESVVRESADVAPVRELGKTEAQAFPPGLKTAQTASEPPYIPPGLDPPPAQAAVPEAPKKLGGIFDSLPDEIDAPDIEALTARRQEAVDALADPNIKGVLRTEARKEIADIDRQIENATGTVEDYATQFKGARVKVSDLKVGDKVRTVGPENRGVEMHGNERGKPANPKGEFEVVRVDDKTVLIQNERGQQYRIPKAKANTYGDLTERSIRRVTPRSEAHRMAQEEMSATPVGRVIQDNLAEVDANQTVQMGAGFNPFGRSKVTRGPGPLPTNPQSKPLLDQYIETERGTGLPGLGSRAKEGFKDRFILFHQLRGDAKEFFADAREHLRQVMAVPRVSRRTATDAMRGVVGDLRAEEFNVVKNRIIGEDFAEAIQRGEALPGGLAPQDVTGRLPQLVAEVDANPRLKAAYDRHRKLMQAVQDDLVTRGKLDAANARKNYFHHEVIEHLDKQGGIGPGRRIKTPQRGYLKERKGSVKDINTDYLDVSYRHLSKVFADNAMDDAILKVAGEYADRVKNGQWTGPTVDWQPQQGNAIYRAATTTDAQVISAIQGTLQGVAQNLNLNPSIFKEGLVLGGKRKSYTIPAELAHVLDNFKADNSYVPGVGAKILGKWKQFVLNKNPIRYNRRNFLGDSERALNAIPSLASPAGAKAFKDAFQDVVAAVKGGKMTRPDDYAAALQRDVVSGGEIAYEIGQVKNMPEFVNLDPKAKYKHMLRFAGQELQDATVARENLLRLTTHYYNMDRVRAGLPIKTGISDIKGLTNPADQVAKVSREALGDYGAFTPFENEKLRNGLAPFYSWLKINTTFWPMLVARQGAKTAATGAAVTAPIRAARTAAVLVKASAIYAAAAAWNNSQMAEIEDSLPDYTKNRFHIVLGKNDDGKPIVLTDPTAFSDFMETIGAEGLSPSVVQLLRGQISAKDFALDRAEEVAKAPVRKAVNLLNPAIKAVGEVPTGRKLFPDPFKPGYTSGNLLERTAGSLGASEFSDAESFQRYIDSFRKSPFPGITGAQVIEKKKTKSHGPRPPGAPKAPAR